METGGIVPVTNFFTNAKKLSECRVTFEIKAKTLEDNLPKTVELVQEIMLKSCFDDGKRLSEILAELKIKTAVQPDLRRTFRCRKQSSVLFFQACGHSGAVINGMPFIAWWIIWRRILTAAERIAEQAGSPDEVYFSVREPAA